MFGRQDTEDTSNTAFGASDDSQAIPASPQDPQVPPTDSIVTPQEGPQSTEDVAPVASPFAPSPEPALPAPDPMLALPATDSSTSSAITLPDQNDANVSDLVDIKSKALDELYPIIHKLDLSAEENFKTLMMMIQATDNKDLIGQAYETAEKIEDEAVRARALLDIVNEINYFTNHPSIDQ